MGVGALELARKAGGGSAYRVSRNVEAAKMAASEGSDATMECSRTGWASQSRRFWPMDRKMTSRASCVRPR
jgi:hypothetical protein